jgi:hypothetical protein
VPYYTSGYIDDGYFENDPVEPQQGGYYEPGYIDAGYFADAPAPATGIHLIYYSALLGQWAGTPNGVFDLDSDTLKVSAHTDLYSPNLDVHDFWDDTSNEVSGGGYSSGGAVLPGVTVSIASGTVTFDAGDVVWLRSATGFTNARKFVVYRSTGTPGTSRLFSVFTANNDVGNSACDLVLSGA